MARREADTFDDDQIDELEPELSWELQDIERKWGFRGAKYTGFNAPFTLGLGIVLAVLIYAALYPFMASYVSQMFYQRGPVPFVVTFIGSWCTVILFVKWRKLCFQERALPIQIVDRNLSFSITKTTAKDVIDNIYKHVDNPKHFVLFNRIELALSNLKNIGRIGDVDDILRSQAENDESFIESSYTLVKVFIWAIPVLGFIGTVMGLSQAIGSFGGVLGSSAEVSQIKDGLREVTSGLAVAFETTLQALVFALIIQLLTTAVKKREEDFLDDCMEYCIRNITARLRIEQEIETVDESLMEMAAPKREEMPDESAQA